MGGDLGLSGWGPCNHRVLVRGRQEGQREKETWVTVKADWSRWQDSVSEECGQPWSPERQGQWSSRGVSSMSRLCLHLGLKPVRPILDVPPPGLLGSRSVMPEAAWSVVMAAQATGNQHGPGGSWGSVVPGWALEPGKEETPGHEGAAPGVPRKAHSPGKD